jgi:hypothetical protein
MMAICLTVIIMFLGLYFLSKPIVSIRTYYNNRFLPLYANGITGIIKGAYVGLFLRIVISIIRGKRNGKLSFNSLFFELAILTVIMTSVFGLYLIGAIGFDIPFLLFFSFLFLSIERRAIE